MVQLRSIQLLKIGGIFLLATVIIVAAGLLNYRHLQRQEMRIPAAIRNELTFSPFIITLDNNRYKASDYKLSYVADNVQLFTYIVTVNDTSVTVSEYTQPPEFSDIPEYRDRFLTNIIKQQKSIQTANGTVYVGTQQKQNGKQIAVMLERGLIVLLNPEKDLSDAQWRSFAEQLEIQKISRS